MKGILKLYFIARQEKSLLTKSGSSAKTCRPETSPLVDRMAYSDGMPAAVGPEYTSLCSVV